MSRALFWLACLAFINWEWISNGAEVNGIGKVVRQYSLVSANDFPQRDPQDWRLLGSADGGRTWTTLDIRTNEIFARRQQKRDFVVANPKACEIYRLQIDRVRDRRAANSVQLAEIELSGSLGGGDDLVPVFNDKITAQGDNPPVESVAELFDGRVETKWLDRPANRLTCASWVQWQYSSAEGVVITNLSEALALRERAADGYHVRIDGVIAGRSDRAGLYVVDSAACIELGEVSNLDEFKTGQRVTLEGVSEWKDDRVDLARPQIEAHGPNPPDSPEQISVQQALPPGEDLKWVRVEGEIQAAGNPEKPGDYDLQDGDLAMHVHLQSLGKSSVLPKAGTRVALNGICRCAFNEQGQWIAANLWVVGTGAIAPASQNTVGPAAATSSKRLGNLTGAPVEITKIDQIRKLTQEQLRSRPEVKIRGIITDLVGAFIQDDTAGIQFAFPANKDENRQITEVGMYVELEGVAGLGDLGNPIISANRITILGRGKLPKPQRLSLSQLMNGQMDAQWIEMEGVVRATDGAHLLMICYGREVTASIGSGSVVVVKNLVDAAIRVRGVGVTALDDKGRIQGIHLLIPSLEQLEVVEAPVDPFSKPVQPIGSLLGLSGPRESFHRVHLQGTVTLQEGQKFFLQDNTGSAMGILKEEVLLDARFGRSRWLFWQSSQNGGSESEVTFSPGDQLEVTGFPETRGYSPVLTEVTVRKADHKNPLEPVKATSDAIAAGTLDSTLVTLDGFVRGQNSLGAHNALALEWNDRTLQVLVSTNVDIPMFALGTRLRVTGVCQIDSIPYAELGLRVGAVRILPRSVDDFVVLERPPWWTVRRALDVMGGMVFVILAAFIWIKQLRRQVEERTNQLTTEIQLREQTERQRSLEKERARIAQDLHDDLGANLTQIVFLSQRVEAAQQDAQEVDRWFHLIPATAKKTIQSLDEIVWAINPRHDSLESLSNYLTQFAQQHMGLAQVRCLLDVPMVLPAITLTAEVRHKLLLAAREALQNVATHAAATEVKVSLKLDDENLVITVSDNGRGFDSNRVGGEGNGLSNMQRRLEDIGGRIEFVSQPGKGTVVRFVIQRERLHGRVMGTNGHS